MQMLAWPLLVYWLCSPLILSHWLLHSLEHSDAFILSGPPLFSRTFSLSRLPSLSRLSRNLRTWNMLELELLNWFFWLLSLIWIVCQQVQFFLDIRKLEKHVIWSFICLEPVPCTARESETSRSIIRKNLLRQLCPLLTDSFNSFSFHFTHFRWYLGMVMNDV